MYLLKGPFSVDSQHKCSTVALKQDIQEEGVGEETIHQDTRALPSIV